MNLNELNTNKDVRKEYIMNNLKEKLQWLRKNTGHEVFAIFLRGSQNYELDVYSEEYMSDIDAMAIILPNLQEVLRGDQKVTYTYILDDNSHIDVKDIRLFEELWYKANPAYLEILFTEFYLCGNQKYEKYLKNLFKHRNKIAEMNFDRFLSATKGMITEKRKALCHPYPTIKHKIDKYGYDSKQLHHEYRFLYILRDMLLKGKKYSECLVFDDERKKFLLEVKVNNEIYSADRAIKEADFIVDSAKKLVDGYRKTKGIAELNQNTLAWLKEFIVNIIKEKISSDLNNDIARNIISEITLFCSNQPSCFGNCYENKCPLYRLEQIALKNSNFSQDWGD